MSRKSRCSLLLLWRYSSSPERPLLRSRCAAASAAAPTWTTGCSAAPETSESTPEPATTRRAAARATTLSRASRGTTRSTGRRGTTGSKAMSARMQSSAAPGMTKGAGARTARPNDGAKDILDCGQGTDIVYFTEADVVSDDCEIKDRSE